MFSGKCRKTLGKHSAVFRHVGCFPAVFLFSGCFPCFPAWCRCFLFRQTRLPSPAAIASPRLASLAIFVADGTFSLFLTLTTTIIRHTEEVFGWLVASFLARSSTLGLLNYHHNHHPSYGRGCWVTCRFIFGSLVYTWSLKLLPQPSSVIRKRLLGDLSLHFWLARLHLVS